MLKMKTTLGFLAAMVLVATSAAPATIVTWDNDAGDSDWFNPLNWSDDSPPDISDEVTVAAATVQAGDTIVTDLGGELWLTDSDAVFESLIVGLEGDGHAALAMAPGSLWTATASIADLVGSTGYMSVTGPSGSAWTVATRLTVGASGAGSLDLQGDMQSGSGVVGLFFQAQGAVVVSGGAWICDTDLTVGMYGDGELTIDSGGSVIGSFCTIGFSEGVSGSVAVSSMGELTVDGLVVGYSGNGSLAVDDASVSSGTAIIGGKWRLMQPGSGAVTVSGGGQWDCTGDLFVGEDGSGDVAVASQSSVTCVDSYVGFNSEAIGTVSITDEGSNWNGANMFVGCYGQGSVSIDNGLLDLAGRLYLGYRPGGSGTLSVNGDLHADEVRVGGDITEGSSETFRTDGLLEVLHPTADIWITSALRFGACGAINAAPDSRIRMGGGSFFNESTDPAALDGLLNVELDFAIPAAGGGISTAEVAAMDTGAGVPGLDLAGRFALAALTIGTAGAAEVQLVDASDNQPDSEGPEAMYVGELVLGTGSTLDLNGLNLYYNTLVDLGGTVVANGGSLQQIYLAGDVDDDGDVDLEDFVALKKSFGATQDATRADGDLNGDGAVDLEDFVILKKNFGQ